MDLREIAALHQTLTLERRTMTKPTSTLQFSNTFRMLRYQGEPGKPAHFRLEHEGRVLDPDNYNDWVLGGRCLRMVDGQMANRQGIDSFQLWVNWTTQSLKFDAAVSRMIDLWESFKLTPAGTVVAERMPEPPTLLERMLSKPAPREVVQLKMKRLHERAMVPTFGTDGAACFDLYAMTEFDGEVYATSRKFPNVIIETGWAFEVPEGWVMKVYSRSGQGFKDNTRLANCVGIIDSDYRGPLRVKLTRDDGEILFVRHGDRVAQAMLERVPVVQFVEVEELSDTQRGEAGYGSTGR